MDSCDYHDGRSTWGENIVVKFAPNFAMLGRTGIMSEITVHAVIRSDVYTKYTLLNIATHIIIPIIIPVS